MTPDTSHEGLGLRVLDLFSGIGGFSLGLERAGMKTVAFCEISPKCRHLLATHWPDVPCFDDVTTLTGEQVGRVDVICGGFPCQDISFAGKGAGLAGERSGLWRHYARLIGELRPDYVIVENVAALLGRGLGDVLGDLAALGYDAWWDCIPAAAVGAPHRRDRLWLVAYPRGVEHQGYGDALRREIAAKLSRPAAFNIDVPDAAGDRWDQGHPDAGRRRAGGRSEQRAGSGGRGDEPALAHAFGQRGCGGYGERQDAVHAHPCREAVGAGNDGGWWSAEPDVGRVAHGVPARVDRLHGLGNAVVPQIPEILGRAILSARALQHQAAA